jgi:putative membrane protein
MLAEAQVAWVHFLGIFVLVAMLAAELALYRREMSAADQRLLKRVDLAYGLSALWVVLTGLARVFWFGKGAWYYAQNSFFWLLIVLFAVVGALSVPPTLQYLGWKAAAPIVIDEPRFRRVRLYLVLEAALQKADRRARASARDRQRGAGASRAVIRCARPITSSRSAAAVGDPTGLTAPAPLLR